MAQVPNPPVQASARRRKHNPNPNNNSEVDGFGPNTLRHETQH